MDDDASRSAPGELVPGEIFPHTLFTLTHGSPATLVFRDRPTGSKSCHGRLCARIKCSVEAREEASCRRFFSMQVKLCVALLALAPLLAVASPTPAEKFTKLKVKRQSFMGPNGVVDVSAVNQHVSEVQT